ncbi:unnamed protein product [Ilex paraguariensis]|uniref:Uncharacterized protein n=1 Tax=Ilex paraguariensis TaxID=185542 RepID=A0ABC8USF3_9AQUA
MLQDMRLAWEKLCDFVSIIKAQEVASRGPKSVVNAIVEGFVLVAVALPCLFNNTLKIRETVDGQAMKRQTHEAAEEWLRLERQAREDTTELALHARKDAAKQLRLELQAREDATQELRLTFM